MARKYEVTMTFKSTDRKTMEVWKYRPTSDDALDAVVKAVERAPKRLISMDIIAINAIISRAGR